MVSPHKKLNNRCADWLFSFFTGDARFCGATASLCGIEKARAEGDAAAMERAVRLDLTLHAMMFLQNGIPMLYSGDEIAQTNDNSYKKDPNKADDSRYLHRGKMRWDLAQRRKAPSTPEGRVFSGLIALNELRRHNPAFSPSADVWTLDTGDDGVLSTGVCSPKCLPGRPRPCRH